MLSSLWNFGAPYRRTCYPSALWKRGEGANPVSLRVTTKPARGSAVGDTGRPVTCHTRVPIMLGVGLPGEGHRAGGGGVPTATAPTPPRAGAGGNGPAAALGAQKMLGFLISPAQPRLFYL